MIIERFADGSHMRNCPAQHLTNVETADVVVLIKKEQNERKKILPFGRIIRNWYWLRQKSIT
jgi:hypothetical protein